MAKRQVKGPRVRKSASISDLSKETKVKEKADKRRSPWQILKSSVLVKNPLVGIVLAVLVFVGKLLLKITPSYFVNSWHEVKRVTWPNRRETWRLTIAVFIFAIVFGGLVAAVDKGIDEIIKRIILG